MSGFELQAALAEKGVTLPVVFVTAEDDDAARRNALAVNAAGFFRRPVDGPALIDAIGWALDKHKKHIAADKVSDPGFSK